MGDACTALFLVADGFECRRCAGLTFRSQCQSIVQRLYSRAFAIYRRINLDYSQAPRVHGPKPKGMRWKTYYSLLAWILEFDLTFM